MHAKCVIYSTVAASEMASVLSLLPTVQLDANCPPPRRKEGISGIRARASDHLSSVRHVRRHFPKLVHHRDSKNVLNKKRSMNQNAVV